MKAVYGGDIPFFAGGDTGEFECHFNGFGAAVGEETVLQIAGCDGGNGAGEIAAQGVEQFLGMQGLVFKLCLNGGEDFGIVVAEGEDAEAAQAVDELLPV